ncbi:MAG: hypothetical protein JJU29_24045 [Verrucomicrobia bacterium]|nr:hypothetical protein [Verrucomicrobiota bacterium]MCC5851175.1 hypothetical protein [Verrucomicrobiota bacterium]
MAQKNGYKDLDESMSPSELVESLLRQGPEKAEMKEIWKQAMFMSWFNPFLTIGWVLLEKLEWRSNERKHQRERNQSEKPK